MSLGQKPSAGKERAMECSSAAILGVITPSGALWLVSILARGVGIIKFGGCPPSVQEIGNAPPMAAQTSFSCGAQFSAHVHSKCNMRGILEHLEKMI